MESVSKSVNKYLIFVVVWELVGSSMSAVHVESDEPIDSRLQPLFLEKGIDLSASIRIGTGSYSAVLTARLIHSHKHRQIAVKVINREKVSNDYVNYFLPRELYVWKKLNHPNLVRLLGHYEVDRVVFLTMEYGPRGDMLQYIKDNGPTPEPRASRWMSQLVAAVSHLHSINIAHRDLKLENVIIFSEDLVKIGDFGFATEAVGGRLSSTFCGSKAYSAPEVILGKPYDPFKSDVWSLGVVIYVVVVDMMPFNQNIASQQFAADHKNRKYSYPQGVKLSPECRFSIDAMLTYSPIERPDIGNVASFPWPCNSNR